MNAVFWIPLLTLFSSFFTGVFIFFLREDQKVLRTILNMLGAIIKLIFTAIIFWGTIFAGINYETRFTVIADIELLLRVDLISLMFVSLSAVLWLITTVYAIGYLERSPHRSRFFGFFSLCVTATMGVALAGNLFTFFIFYEMLTLATYPLVVHRGTRESLRAGRNYLLYTLSGGALFLAGIVWLESVAGTIEFQLGGVVAGAGIADGVLISIFILMMAGLGVKAAIVPLHSWLPQAMVAPAPVSALLHAVAVVKAGAYGIVRLVYEVYGIVFAAQLGILLPLAILAAITIIYGSLRALAQDDLKRRLAYSTVSQLSYITLGVAILGPLASIGALVHLVHQGLMKITLFFCAGNFTETLGVKRIDELDGIGRRMPWSMTAFTIGAFGMIGVPPLAGFVSKWYLSLGGLEAGMYWVPLVFVTSSVLNAMYFLPIVYRGWFRPPREDVWKELIPRGPLETKWTLLAPAIATAILSLFTGLFAGSWLSPLALAELIVLEMYVEGRE
ncbi:MAG: monovalent cation/H+ antiporter subunit D family protein [Phycisphaerales bacterium]|nr:MAG: monovalent cation/H+ antiporter subunit D family protein [Phycisphaerales bacterium]